MIFHKDVLVAEISGKRSGTSKERPTEKFNISYPHLIISNDSTDYVTDWDIVNVPEDYKQWYINNIATSDKAYYAPMNRSYAIKYAREHGYKYLIQLDDNIKVIAIAYSLKDEFGIDSKYLSWSSTEMMDDFISYLVTVLKNSNAGICGCNLFGCSVPNDDYLCERFVYSLFALKLDVIPDNYQGDFEDDIEFRYKLWQMGIPSIQVSPLKYGKVSAKKNNDLTGCRKAYKEVGVNRGGNMSKIYGDFYKRGLRSKSNGLCDKKEVGKVEFQHRMKKLKVGVALSNKRLIDEQFKLMLEKNARFIEDSCKVKSNE